MWKNIRDEYLWYSNKFDIPLHNKISAITSLCDNKNKWKTLYLRAFNIDTEISKFFPMTMKLINMCPCTLAFFSVLEPNAKLSPHVGIYKGVIRYHLGLIIPDEWYKCFINVNGQILYWREGDDIMFDDMFMHSVENNTTQQRVILFMDIKRDFHNIFLNILNTVFLNFIKSNDALKTTIGNANSETNIKDYYFIQ
jgi:beta-hydroxylase